MSAIIIDGKKCAADLREKVSAMIQERKLRPHLAVVVVGDDPASAVYVRNKERACKECGIVTSTHRLGVHTQQDDVERLIDDLNNDDEVTGILVQLPLPDHLDTNAILQCIDWTKDVDGFTEQNIGGLSIDPYSSYIPCTPLGIVFMLDYYKIPIGGKHVVIVGRSNIVGKPLANLMLSRDATVTVCHSKTLDLAEYTKRADILVAAVGKAGIITADMVKPGAVVIDVGINRVDGKLCGDVDFEAVSEVAGYITPVPGGVGPMTVAALMSNTGLSANIMSHAERPDTASLVDELCSREGVESHAVAPYEDFELTVNGPARILVVTD